MSALDQVYRCDACGKETPWKDAANKWARIEVRPFSWPSHRREATKHACSTACEKRVLLALAGETFTPEAVEAEAAAARPDLMARLDEERARHGATEAENERLKRTIRAFEEERSRAAPPPDPYVELRDRADRARVLADSVEQLGMQVKRAATALEGVLREMRPDDADAQ